MSTPDSGGGSPEEVNLLLGHAPSPTTAHSVPGHVPTPGVALAGARVPGAPTLPDWDPATLTMVMSRMANDLFGASAAAAPVAVPTSTVPTAAATGSVPTIPSTVATPTAPSPATSWSPFHSAPNLDAFADAGVHPSALGELANLLRFPLFDPEEAPPVTAAPARGTIPTSQPLAIPDHELDPLTSPALAPTSGNAFDAYAIRREFPILEQRVNGKRLVWLDNAATTQKPRAVIDRLSKFYETENSNIHRAAHTLATRATEAYEGARESVRRFVNAPSVRDVVFVRGATEGINLVAQSWGRRNVGPDDEIVVSWLEHHANIVPWQMLAAEKGARLRVAPVDDTGQIILSEYEKLLGPRTRIVSITQVSNALGTITPIKQIVDMAHRHGAKVLVDGAQAVSHMRVDVQALDSDFYVFSGHKVFAPTGIGAVIAKGAVLEEMPPWQGGGNMIEDVTFERTRYQPPPARFEAGTGNIADAVGLGAALDWLTRVGIENVSRHEHDLLVYATEQLATVPGLTMIGTAAEKAGVVSFVLAGQKTEEVGGLLDKEGIAVRSGHHCAQPILRRFGVEHSVRASFAPYNTCEDVDALVAALHRLQSGRATRS